MVKISLVSPRFSYLPWWRYYYITNLKKLQIFLYFFYSFCFMAFELVLFYAIFYDFFVFLDIFKKKAPENQGLFCLHFRSYLTTVSCLHNVSRHRRQQLVVILYSTDNSNSSGKIMKTPQDKPKGQMAKFRSSQIHTTTLRRQPRSSTQLINSGSGYSIFKFKFKELYFCFTNYFILIILHLINY